MQAVVVIETGFGQATGVAKELKKTKDELRITEMDLLVSGPYQILLRVSLDDEAETMAVEKLIEVIPEVVSLDVWICNKVGIASR